MVAYTLVLPVRAARAHHLYNASSIADLPAVLDVTMIRVRTYTTYYTYTYVDVVPRARARYLKKKRERKSIVRARIMHARTHAPACGERVRAILKLNLSDRI